MKKVFVLNDFVSGGGAEAVMRDNIKHMYGKYDITVMTFDDDCQAAKEIFPAGVKYIPAKIKQNPYGRRNPLHYPISLYNRLRTAYIRSKRYDVAIANKEGPCMKFVSKMQAGRKLAWVHVDYQYLYWTKGCFKNESEKACMQRFDRVICVSEAACQSVKKVIGDPGNLCVRYNPIDYAQIRRNAQESTTIERNESKPLFVAVGRIAKEKNFVTLAKVCARLSREFDFELWIVGDGNQRAEVEAVLREENCSSVKILGMQSNPHKYLARADCLISSSLGESYGLVIQEALILGIPVLSTRCPAIEECLDTRFGRIVDCDEAAIEKGIRSILEDPKCLDAYKEAIRKEYAAEDLWNPRLEKIESLIKDE